MSNFYLPTLRQAPQECDTISSQLMFRAGLIRKIASGIYNWLPLGLRVLKKIEQIIREEMDNIGGLEVWLPHILPREIWEETGRWYLYGKELFRLKDRKGGDFCLSPTAEEVITSLIRNELRSYKVLPKMFYQFGVKFRDEIRPRFGVIRAREFYMKDAYSFHKDDKDLENFYKKVYDAYCKIFSRCGLKFVVVEAATGAIGGKFSHEFMVIKNDGSFIGEEVIVYCSNCGYSANIEKAECVYQEENSNKNIFLDDLKEIYTPNLKTVEEVSNFLNEPPQKFIKTLVYKNNENNDRYYIVLIRGDYEVNESKLKSLLELNDIQLADSLTIENTFGIPVGFLGPVGLKDKFKKINFLLIADKSLKYIANAISGANKKDYHLKNININRDYEVDIVADIRNIVREDLCPKCKNKSYLNFSKGIEVGHTFKLGDKYSKSMQAFFLDENNTQKNFIMGCYGIGVSRIIAAFIEQSHDDDGIIWHPNISPFLVYLLPIDYNDFKIREITDHIYKLCYENKIDILLDDRDERPGVKFKDSDLIGIPIRLTVSKNLPANKVELYIRKTKLKKIIDIDKVLSEIFSTSIELINKI